MFKRIALALVAALIFCQAPTVAQTTKTYKARLSPVPVAAASPDVTGIGSVTATLTGAKLSISGTFEGLASPATFAKLHRGPKGIRGPAVLDLTTTSGTSGKISGSMDLTQPQREDLARERFYVQLHSEKASDGNLWGWLLAQENK